MKAGGQEKNLSVQKEYQRKKQNERRVFNR